MDSWRYSRKVELATLEKLVVFAVLVIALNIPFGYWRANSRQFSLGWALAIHLPVPVIIVMRLLFGFSLYVLPLSALLFFVGQLAGGKLREAIKKRLDTPTSCMVMDLAGLLSGRVTG